MAIYSDINTKTPFITSRVYDINSIVQAIENIIKTPPRQRLFKPEGLPLGDALFEIGGFDAERKMKNIIAQAVERDPRVSLDFSGTNVTFNPITHEFKINLKFRIEGIKDTIFERQGVLRR